MPAKAKRAALDVLPGVAGAMVLGIVLGEMGPRAMARMVDAADCVERALPSVAVPASTLLWRCLWEMR